ncbi:MAG: DUF1501 domain-containing protein [Planctomycetota bacterium]|nr:MAG: DUF1501 domain-containing protein [Planctomycetota bacterium]REJ98490.1 MAG: DUF1501 domain-containing protein [Planctomycetota bacterium]REK23596.1 MAG: DUF1501 domain-containing protein [Planctomycetota bacterium]REK31179.1 MAG: DUF1501 domain-containing protein [Planctomycetota bacterium]
MFRVSLGSTRRYCDGLPRRSFVQLGLAGLGTLGLGDVFRAKAAASPAGATKDTSLILIWLDGGPSHMDTYDPKPNAPAEYRGIWRHIPTNVPGFDITEMFPLQAQIADLYSVVRSVHHDAGDHFTGGHWMLTGRGGVSGAMNPQKSPFFGAIAGKVLGPRTPGMPAVVGVPYAMSIGLRPGYFGGHYLGVEHNPFETEGDPNAENFQVNNLNLAGGLTVDRLEDRGLLNSRLDRLHRELDRSGTAEAMDQFEQQAFDLVSGSQARTAFDISQETPEMRERYGRNSWGQSVLLARRLVEAGSTIVTCHFGGWDSHWNHQGTMESHLPRVDRAVHGLLTDLQERGRLDSTLVMVCGEFGRTPRMNDGGNGGPPMSKGTPGRDHWGNALSVMMAGGGLKGGQIVGSTNRLGERPAERPLRPGDIHHTIFHVLGVDPDIAFKDHSGRPIPAIDHGAVISELV